MRRMSFMLTSAALCKRRKTVTRRRVTTWRGLQPGDRLLAVAQAQGLRKGERQQVLATIEVVGNIVIAIDDVTLSEVRKEGFAGFSIGEFLDVLHHAMPGETHCRRIEFRIVDGGDA